MSKKEDLKKAVSSTAPCTCTIKTLSRDLWIKAAEKAKETNPANAPAFGSG